MADRISKADRLKAVKIVFNTLQQSGLRLPPGDPDATAALWATLLEEPINKKGTQILIQAAKNYINTESSGFVHYKQYRDEVDKLTSSPEAKQREAYLRNLAEVERRAEAEQERYLRERTPEQVKAAAASYMNSSLLIRAYRR